MTTIHHSSPPGTTPFAIYEDPEDLSELYEGDVSLTSEMGLSSPDIAIPSIEGTHDVEEPEPYCGSYTSRPSILSSSRRGSDMTANSFVSSLPSEVSVASKPVAPANTLDARYSPRKERPPFRNPSSVRAMQMSSPPPLLEATRERIKGYKLATPSKPGRSESVSTTGTRRSRSHIESAHREYQAQSPRAAVTPQPMPLVLLHITILPMQMPYAPDVMVKIMPEWLVENYKILEEKLQDVVLMHRGLLIQHPRDEYDLLEERILESLELKTPRLLKCGHFMAPDSDDEETLKDDEENMSQATGRGIGLTGGTATVEDDPEFRYPTPISDDASVCVDCHRQVKKPGHGVGAGTKRWDIKIYAANGLMREGAWSAAWSEMERCDVEISPWVPNEVRKSLEKRLEQEQEAARRKALYTAELQRQMEEEAITKKKLEEETETKRKAEEAELQRAIEAQADALQRKLDEEAAAKRQLEETLNAKIEEAKEAIRLEFESQALAEANCVAGRFRAMEEALKSEREKATAQASPVLQVPRVASRSRSRSRHRSRSRSRRPRAEEIPLGTLLKNYFVLQVRDTRNVLILVLGALLVSLLTNPNPGWNSQHPTVDAPGQPLADAVKNVAPVVVTSTATVTATSISTLVVTEVQSLEVAGETSSPSSGMVSTGETSSVWDVAPEEPTTETSLPSEPGINEETVDSENVKPEELVATSVYENAGPIDDKSAIGNLESESLASSESPSSNLEAMLGENSSVPTEFPSQPAAVEEINAEPFVTEELEKTTEFDQNEEAEVTEEIKPNTEREDEVPGLSEPLESASPAAELSHGEGEDDAEAKTEAQVVEPQADASHLVPDDEVLPDAHGRDEL